MGSLNPYRVNEHREALLMVRQFRTGVFPEMRGDYGRKMATAWLETARLIRLDAWKPWDMERLVWVCQCCILTHANGECCDSPEHGGDSCEPLSRCRPEDSWAMGGVHADGCGYQDGVDCDCETIEFDRSQCDGCGSWLAGSRHAMTVFVNDRRFIPAPVMVAA